MRSIARETAFKIQFASQFTPCEESLRRAMYKADRLTEDDVAYCENIFSSVAERCDEFARILDSHSRLFPESRLFYADRSVLYIALAEIYCRNDIPPAVTVNEAVNIAAKYSSEKSAGFVNGILSEIIKERKNVQTD